MASSCRCHHRHRDLHFTSVTPHFFKIILAHILNQGKLNVPKKFVLKHGEALQNEEVCLKVASGEKWKVGLKKSNEKVWFEKGWQQFVEFYSIGVGYFLTFRYETNWCFHVTIFDLSASEIEYPIHHFGEFDGQIRGFQMPKIIDCEEFEDDGSVHILGYKRRREEKFTQTKLYSEADKKIKICSDYEGCKRMEKEIEVLRNEDLLSSKFKATRKEEQVVSKANTSKSKHNQESPTIKIESRDFKGHKVIKSENYWRKQPIDQERVTEKASTFQSMTANPSFMVTMAPSYIHTGKGVLNIPKSFAKVHVKKSQEISLEVSDRRVWKIWCGVRASQNLDKKTVEMKDGWKAFAGDNNLEEGNICVFELMEGTKISFKVTIFR